MNETNAQVFRKGMKDAIPIGLGYLAVAFSLGIAARNAGTVSYTHLTLPTKQGV